jgi:hypothetical protein
MTRLQCAGISAPNKSLKIEGLEKIENCGIIGGNRF